MIERATERIILLVIPACYVILAIAANFFPELLNALGILGTNNLLGIIAGALILIGLNLEVKFRRVEGEMQSLQIRTEQLVSAQQSYLDRMRRPVEQSSFAEIFRKQSAIGNRIGVLRVFAVSSQQILSFMRFENFQIEECRLLLRGFEPHDTQHKEFASQIQLAVRDWHRLALERKVRTLIIRTYDFFPTEYQVIFDDQNMLSGLYDSDPNDYSGVAVRSPLYIDGATADGRAVIVGYRERFDKLFEVCADHHGQNQYDEFCVPKVG